MKFGIELECYDVNRQNVAYEMQRAGLNVMVASYCGQDYSVWQLKTDGSIDGMNGFEVVSPVLQGEQGIEEVRKVCKILNDMGVKVNKSCGFHVHHDVQGWGIKEFRNLFKRFIKFEAALDSVQPSSRRGNSNRYIQSVAGTYNTKTKLGSIARMAQIDTCRSIRQLSELFNNNRYFKLNLQSFFRSGTVEFRNHAGTIDADKVENYIRLTAGMVTEAKNHVAIKPFEKDTTAKEGLEMMLAGMTRRGSINAQIAKFYKERAKKMEIC